MNGKDGETSRTVPDAHPRLTRMSELSTSHRDEASLCWPDHLDHDPHKEHKPINGDLAMSVVEKSNRQAGSLSD